jgi:fatty acid amide hydrolase
MYYLRLQRCRAAQSKKLASAIDHLNQNYFTDLPENFASLQETVHTAPLHKIVTMLNSNHLTSTL